jgi:hypothetical protein
MLLCALGFHMVSAMNGDCTAASFPIELNNTQCYGLDQASHASQEECVNACCEDTDCEVWQWCPKGAQCASQAGESCWLGQLGDCDHPDDGWVSKGRHRGNHGNWSRPLCGTPQQGQDIISQWGKAIKPSSPVLAEYPRPQMARPESTYFNLNGLWELQTSGSDDPPFNTTLSDVILVPFPLESCLSGIGKPYTEVWYRRPPSPPPHPSPSPTPPAHSTLTPHIYTTSPYSEVQYNH